MLAYSRGKVFCYQSMLNHQSVMPCPSSMLYLHLHLKYTDSSSSSMSQIRSSSSSTITETRSVEPPRRNFPRWLRQLEDPAHIPIFSVIRMSEILKRSDSHMTNITDWILTEDVKDIVKGTCFSQFLRLKEIMGDVNFGIPLPILEALGNAYDKSEHCFRLGNDVHPINLDFGLEDIWHITGLPIDGTQVSGHISCEPIKLVKEHLHLDLDQAKPLFKDFNRKDGEVKKGAMIQLDMLHKLFGRESTIDVSPEVKAKAFILFLLGTLILPRRARTVMPELLLFLDFDNIDSYAWGAACLASIKESLAEKDLSVKKKSICCFTLALAAFAMERFPSIRGELDRPSETPLCLGWINNASSKLFARTRNRKSVSDYERIFTTIVENDIDWNPYNRFPPVPDHQLRMRYAMVPCIYFFVAHMVRPDLCFKQLGLEANTVNQNLVVPKVNVIKQNRQKDIDLRVYTGSKKNKCNYKELNDMWANRDRYIVNVEFLQREHEDDHNPDDIVMATDGTPHSSGAPENEVNDDQQEPGPLVNAQQVLDPHEPTPSTPEVQTTTPTTSPTQTNSPSSMAPDASQQQVQTTTPTTSPTQTNSPSSMAPDASQQQFINPRKRIKMSGNDNEWANERDEKLVQLFIKHVEATGPEKCNRVETWEKIAEELDPGRPMNMSGLAKWLGYLHEGSRDDVSWSRIDKGKGVAGQSGAPLSESVMGDDVQFPARGLALRKYFFSHVQETLGFDESSIFNFVAGWSEDRFINFLGMSITGQRNVLNSLLGRANNGGSHQP